MQLVVDRLNVRLDPEPAPLVLDAVTLSVAESQFAAVLGPSGSGKTTLLRVIAGLVRCDSGTVTLGSERVDHLPPERRGVGMVPQDGALFPHLSVRENIAFGLPRADRGGDRIAQMLELFSLTAFAGRLPHQLSGGQAQRVAVARALAPGPRLLLLDEPFSALDASLRHEVRHAVRDALAETSTTALLVTHDQGEALSLAEQVTIIRDGRVLQTGTPAEVYEAPADVWTGTFVGEANVFSAMSDGATARTPLGAVAHSPVIAGGVDVLIRPEQVRVLEHAPPNATVTKVQFFGHDALVDLRLDTGATVTARSSRGELPRRGARVAAGVSGPATVFPA